MRRASQRWRHGAWVGALLLGVGPVHAIDITIHVDNPQNFPSFDPNGEGLKSVAKAAAQMWEKLRPGPNTYSINIHWEDWGDDAELGIANIDYSIRINSAYEWFIDPTPFQNEEFASFTSLFYRDLTSAEKFDSFNGPVPDMLEYSYSANAWANGDAFGKTDLLTVVLHEIGHLTGIGWNAFKPDVPLSPFWLGNRQGVEVARRNEAHIDPEGSLMDPDTAASQRTLPSALDVMVNANEKGNANVNLDRIDYIGNVFAPDNIFTDPFAWSGGQFPGVDEQAFIRNHESVYHLGGIAEIDNLTLTDYGDLLIQAGTVDANKIRIDYNGTLVIESGASANVTHLTVGFDGLTQLNGGTLNGEYILINDVGTIAGHGVLNATEELNNEGIIEGQGGVLEIYQDNFADIELDGVSGSGWLVAKNGSIANHAFDIEFKGVMEIHEGQFISMDHFLGMENKSELRFKAAAGGKAQLLGSANGIGLSGKVSVAAGTDAVIRAGSIDISLFDANNIVSIDSSADLSLQGNINYNSSDDGNIVGNGTLHQDGNANVNGDFTIDVKNFNWDGNNEAIPTNTQIEKGVTFTINSETIDPNDGKYDGKATLDEEATLAVHAGSGFLPTWSVGSKGVIEMYDQTRVEGSALQNFGTITVLGGSAEIATNVLLEQGSKTELAPKTSLTVTGLLTTYAGGTVQGQKDLLEPTTFTQASNALVVKDSIIDVTYFEWSANGFNDKTTTIMDGDRFTINAGKIGTPPAFGLTNGTEGFGDTLNINSGILEVYVGADAHVDLPAFWSIQSKGIMNLNPTSHTLPWVEGSLLVNNGLIQGTGQFFNELLNNGVIEVGRDNGIGMIQFFNVFSQTKEGILNLEIAGTGPGTEFDFLLTNAKFELEGTLNVSLFAGYQPSPGDVFRIIDGTLGGERIGTFASVNLPGGLWNIVYGDDFVDLRFQAIPELGSLSLAGLGLSLGIARRLWIGRRRANIT